METKETIITIVAILAIVFVISQVGTCEINSRTLKAKCIQETSIAEVLKCENLR